MVANTSAASAEPRIAFGAIVPHNALLILKDDDVRTQAGDAAVDKEFLAQIDRRGTRRQHLYDQARRRRIQVLGFGWIAHDLHVRVIHSLVANAKPHVAAVDATRSAPRGTP
jgi:hypothetical protein